MSVSSKKSCFIVASWIVAMVVAVPANSQNIAVQSYDLVKDFSITANPHGPFSYGWTSGVPALNAFNLYTTTDSFSVTGMTSWRDPAPYDGAPPFIGHNETQATICAHSYCVPVDELQLLPGFGATYTILRWTAPLAGRANVGVTFRGEDQVGPIDADVHVVLNSHKTIASGQISDDKSLLSFTLTLNVAAGDTVDFAVGNGGTGKPTFDSTGLKGVITLEPCGRCE